MTQVDPESGWLREREGYWVSLTSAYHDVGNYAAELEALDRMRQLYPESPVTRRVEFRTLAALGRIEELGARIPEEIERLVGRLAFTSGIPFRGFEELRAHGYPAAASDLEDRTLEWFEGRTSDWRQDPGQSFVYAKLLSRAGRWDESEAILEDVLKAVPLQSPQQNNVALALAHVLARQGHRERAYRAVGMSGYPNNTSVLASIEAALGERERAMELLRDGGFEFDVLHSGGLAPLESLRDYPPFVEEFLSPKK